MKIFKHRLRSLSGARSVTALLVGLASASAYSQGNMYQQTAYGSSHNSQQPSYDYADIQFVEPVYETFQTSIPKQNCWTETLRPASRSYTNRKGSNEKLTGNLMGGVIGGVIGNAVGKGGDNKKIGAVVGSIIGMSVANNVQNRDRGRYATQHHVEHQRSVQRCEMREELREERRIVSYKVGYRYKGMSYVSNMSRPPNGESLRVVVNVTPADQY